MNEMKFDLNKYNGDTCRYFHFINNPVYSISEIRNCSDAREPWLLSVDEEYLGLMNILFHSQIITVDIVVVMNFCSVSTLIPGRNAAWLPMEFLSFYKYDRF